MYASMGSLMLLGVAAACTALYLDLKDKDGGEGKRKKSVIRNKPVGNLPVVLPSYSIQFQSLTHHVLLYMILVHSIKNIYNFNFNLC